MAKVTEQPLFPFVNTPRRAHLVTVTRIWLGRASDYSDNGDKDKEKVKYCINKALAALQLLEMEP